MGWETCCHKILKPWQQDRILHIAVVSLKTIGFVQSDPLGSWDSEEAQ